MRLSPLALVAALALPGCFLLPKPRLSPAATFGNRPPANSAQEPDVWAVSPPTPGQPYFFFDVPVNTVTPRIEPRTTAPTDSARVELRITGVVPNDCYELDAVTESRVGRFVEVAMRMRLPQGQACRTVVRRFVYYHTLRGRFAPGPYVFTVSGTARPFEIRPRPALPAR